MKKTLSLMLAATLMVSQSLPAQSARQYGSVEAAKLAVTDDGYILFFYPADWDRYGEKLCKKLISDTNIKAAAGNAALILVPVYQNRNEQNNAQAKKIMGSLGYPGDMSDISYPALAFYEKEGRMYTTIHGERLMKASPEIVATLIKEKLNAKKNQDALLAKANTTTNAAEKNKYLLESSRIPGVSWPGGLKDEMKKNDPNDQHGFLGVLDFEFGHQQNETLENCLERLDRVLANPLLSNTQKQRACASVIGHVRRSCGAMAGGSLITKYATIMEQLDPKTTLGLSASVIKRDWVRQYQYGQGWSDQIIPSAPVPMLMHNVPITKPGTYNVHFKLTTGRDGIIVKKLRLMDGDKCVATHDTPCEVSWSAGTQKDITLTVRKSIKNPILEITYGNEPEKRSTWGEITIRQK